MKTKPQGCAEHPPSQKTKCGSAQIQSSHRKNMQEVSDTSTMKCQNMEELGWPWSDHQKGLGIVMKGHRQVDTGLA